MDKSSGLFICFSCCVKGGIPQFLSKIGCSRNQIDSILSHSPSLRRVRKPVQEQTYSILPEYVLGAYDRPVPNMVKKGFSPEFLSENNVGYDKLQRRITFAIRDCKGRLVAVSGRAEDGVFPRYKVYTDEFKHIAENYKPRNKHFLYNMHDIYSKRLHRKTKDPIYLVEGYKGCLWLKKHGFDSVALQGSSLSNQQEKTLARIKSKIIIFLDFEYGKQLYPHKKGAIYAALEIAKRLSKTNEISLINYPDDSEIGRSPDDFTGDELSRLTTMSLDRLVIHLKEHKCL